MENVLIIMNSSSGMRNCVKSSDFIKQSFDKQGIRSELYLTKFSGHASEIAKSAKSSGVSRIIAVGGDGTVNEVAQGLIASNAEDIPVGIIPTGVGNFLAKEFNISKNLKSAITVATTGKFHNLDAFNIKCGDASERLFFGCLGVGLDGDIVKDFTQYRKNKAVSMLSYLKLILKHSMRTNWSPLKLVIDDEEITQEKYYWIVCANTSAYGGPIIFSPCANHSDGLLDVVAFSKPMSQRVLQYATGLSSGTILKNEWAHLYHGKNVKILCEKEQAVQVDGDFAGTTPVEISFTGKRIKIIGE